ncbi:hypothetical protein BSL78_00915 [Apostichopus japonicus]|uniref:Uncharacterized protein n=1 Tax=Stichopus japonicus TaxID=307972 RepID=A0A2G8LPQ0_STIJA|nr:hypothetical protein BSL78_00915 [Apostichopus japonicus]
MDKKSKEYKEWIDSAGKEEHQFGIAVCKQGTEIGLHWTCTETNGKALRERKKKGGKLSNGKGIGGQGHRPTDGCIDKLQLYYGQAIRAHTTEGTTTDTKALTEGYSQNQNDSLNSLVWLRAPKHKHRGARSTEIAVILAMLQYNKGASAKFGVMKRLYPPGSFSSAGSAQKDRERVQFARRAEDDEVKARREKRRQGKRKLEESWLEGTSYESGAFNELDVLQTSQKERSRRKKTTAL